MNIIPGNCMGSFGYSDYWKQALRGTKRTKLSPSFVFSPFIMWLHSLHQLIISICQKSYCTSPGEGKSCPLQYSGLKNFMDCTVYGVAKRVTCTIQCLGPYFHVFIIRSAVPILYTFKFFKINQIRDVYLCYPFLIHIYTHLCIETCIPMHLFPSQIQFRKYPRQSSSIILYAIYFFYFYQSIVAVKCWVSADRKVNQLCVYIYPLSFGFPCHLGHHKILSRVPAKHQVLIIYFILSVSCIYILSIPSS